METATTTTALSRLLDPLSRMLNEEASRSILALRIDPSLQARLEELADRCNEGLLTEAERTEYEDYVESIGLINVLKAMARRALAGGHPAP